MNGKDLDSKKDNFKTESISIRCTSDVRHRLYLEAKQKDKKISLLVREYIEAGLESRRKPKKEKVAIMVKQYQALNDIINSLSPEDEELRMKLIEYAKGVVELCRN